MKNKVELKRCLFWIGVVSLCFLILSVVLQFWEYQSYTRQYNYKLSAILKEVQKEYPDISEEALITIVNSSDTDGVSLVEKYGIDLEKDSVIPQNGRNFWIYLLVNTGKIC